MYPLISSGIWGVKIAVFSVHMNISWAFDAIWCRWKIEPPLDITVPSKRTPWPDDPRQLPINEHTTKHSTKSRTSRSRRSRNKRRHGAKVIGVKVSTHSKQNWDVNKYILEIFCPVNTKLLTRTWIEQAKKLMFVQDRIHILWLLIERQCQLCSGASASSQEFGNFSSIFSMQ